MLKKRIRKVTVLGSGVMGSAIACHFANIGCEALLLDIAPKELNKEEKAAGLQLTDARVRNRIVNASFQRAIKAKPGPLFSKKIASRIALGNFDDDMEKAAACDWIIEVVVENLDIKKALYEKIESYRKPGTLITSNTSGIPIGLLVEGRSEDFKKHFCGVHFFNPPRYLRLLEIIPTPHTDKELISFLMHYGDLYLGKTTVLCKDTPAFIGNRIGVWSMLKVMSSMRENELNIDEVDKLTGPIIGRPKSATFRTGDLVGLDTLIKVARNLYEGLPHDESREVFALPKEVEALEQKGWLGDKSGKGFYQKTKDKQGKTQIRTLDFHTMEYRPRARVSLKALEAAKGSSDLAERLRILLADKGKEGAFYRDVFFALFAYASNRIPEISDDLFAIDDALRAGFGWEMGPFEMWDALDIARTAQKMEDAGHPPAPWVRDMIAAGKTTFYRSQKGKKTYYHIPTKSYKPTPGAERFLLLETHADRIVWHNDESKITDIGDGIINFSWHSKGYTLGNTVIEGLVRAIDLAEKEYKGLVIGHQGADFSLGANLGLVFMYAIEQDYDEIALMVSAFQNTVMRVRYSSVPVVVAPHGRTLGGGCEIAMHADRVQAAAETYIGLVELGVGLLPAGGGTKEFTKRVSDALQEGDVELNALQNAFMHIAMAKVATSAVEAEEMGFLRRGDGVSLNPDRQLAEAKTLALYLADNGYTQPLEAADIKVQGKTGKALFAAGIAGMKEGGYISEHDAAIAMKVAHVMCGGDLTTPQRVSERYLLDLEREAFMSLCGEPKTLERIQAVIKGGKPLRN